MIAFELLGIDEVDVQISCFSKMAEVANKIIEKGKIYAISRGYATPKNAAFDKTKHEFSLRLGEDSVIREVPEGQVAQKIPKAIYNFKPIESITQSSVGEIIDIIGVIDLVEQAQTITKKNGDEATKQSVIIKDMSNYSIEVI